MKIIAISCELVRLLRIKEQYGFEADYKILFCIFETMTG